MRAVIEPSVIRGSLRAPRSKSHAIRLIFSSIISPTEILDLPLSGDVLAALRVVEGLGVRVKLSENRAVLEPGERRPGELRVNVGGSATALRMAIALAATLGVRLEIDGDESLRRRPLDAIYETLVDAGLKVTSSRLPLRVEGRLEGDIVEVRGSESSQYISGFMIAFCMLGGGEIRVKPPLVSRSYVYMTGEVLKLYGCVSEISETRVRVSAGTSRGLVREKVWGDYALAAFYAASALTTGGSLVLRDLPPPPGYFGDHSIVDLFREMGAESRFSEGDWVVRAASDYSPVDADFEDAPDLPLSVVPVAAIAGGCSRLRGVSRLRIKESDRLEAVSLVLSELGVEVESSSGVLVVCGDKRRLRPWRVLESLGDHRVAMMAAALAARVGGVVEGAECVSKSNPGFWRDLESAGGRVRLE